MTVDHGGILRSRYVVTSAQMNYDITTRKDRTDHPHGKIIPNKPKVHMSQAAMTEQGLSR